MTTETTQNVTTTGETMVASISCFDYSLFADKIKHLNKQLAKYGLTPAKVLARELKTYKMSDITGNEEDGGTPVNRWTIQVEIPVATTKIPGHKFVGVVEDLGKGQKIMTGVVTDLTSLPSDPYPEHDYNSDDKDPHAAQRRQWQLNVYYPAFQALRDANTVLLSSLRSEPMKCVHCQTTRARKQTLAFLREDGSLVQVGKDCAKEYFGIDLAGVLQGTWDLQERCGGEARSFSTTRYHQDLFLALWLLKNYGYVSAKVEESYRTQEQFVPVGVPLSQKRSSRTMGEEINDVLYDLGNPENMEKAHWEAIKADPEGQIEAAQAALADLTAREQAGQFSVMNRDSYYTQQSALGLTIRIANLFQAATVKQSHEMTFADYAWAYLVDRMENQESYLEAFTQMTNYWANLQVADTDSFNQNVKAVAIAEVNKSFAMTAMVVFGWMKATTDMPRAAFFVPAHRRAFPATPEAGYLGAVGAMIDVEITVTQKRSGGDDYQPWFLIKGRTSANFEVSLFCKHDLFSLAKEGEELKLRAKVKAHDNYQGKCTTALYYAKVV